MSMPTVRNSLVVLLTVLVTTLAWGALISVYYLLAAGKHQPGIMIRMADLLLGVSAALATCVLFRRTRVDPAAFCAAMVIGVPILIYLFRWKRLVVWATTFVAGSGEHAASSRPLPVAWMDMFWAYFSGVVRTMPPVLIGVLAGFLFLFIRTRLSQPSS